MNKNKTSFTISENNAILLGRYSQEYGVSKGEVINKALALYFELSGYSEDGYSVEAQRARTKEFSPVVEEDKDYLLSPPTVLVERDLYHLQAAGALDKYPPELAKMVINGETEEARRILLNMEVSDGRV